MNSGSDAAITWLGHATTLIELDRVRVMTDPVLRGRVGPLVRIAGPVQRRAIERVDGVLLSHLHADHTDPRSLRDVVGTTTSVVAPLGAGPWLRRKGVGDVRELGAGQRIRIGGLTIAATPALHDGTRPPLGPRAEAVGYVVIGSISVYFGGDTDLFPQMAELRGAIDVALLPVWGWGSRLGPGHLDPERAARAAATIEPRIAIPIHWGTFALPGRARRRPDPARPAREFAALTARYAPSVDVRVLAPGERTEL